MLLLTLFLLPSLCLSAGAGLITDKSVFSNEPEFLDVDKAFILDVYQNKDKIHVIDKKTLEIVKTLQPEPGKTSGHVEFTKDGRYALVSIWDIEGALVIYDAQTLKEIKRLPMSKPSGKYDVYNKTHYEEGTSH